MGTERVIISSLPESVNAIEPDSQVCNITRNSDGSAWSIGTLKGRRVSYVRQNDGMAQR